MTPRKRYTFFIDRALDEGLKTLKQRDGTPESEAIRRAIADYLERRGVAVTTSFKPDDLFIVRAPTRAKRSTALSPHRRAASKGGAK